MAGRHELIDRVLALGEAVRYVSVASGQDVLLEQRAGLADASAAESDRYEELLVNPTLITLARQRGEIDCGGLRYLIVGYGRFWQVVMPMPAGGHVSASVALDADPVRLGEQIAEIVESTASRDSG